MKSEYPLLNWEEQFSCKLQYNQFWNIQTLVSFAGAFSILHQKVKLLQCIKCLTLKFSPVV